MSPYKSLLFIGVLCGFAVNGYAQHELVADSKIESVIVYPDSARVFRTVELVIEPGETECYFYYLPESVDPSSIKALTEGKAGSVLVRDISVKSDDSIAEEHSKLKQLREKAESLENEISKIKNQADLSRERKSYAGKIVDSFTGGYGKREGSLPKSGEVESVWNFYRQTSIDTQAKMDEFEAQLNPLREALETNEEETEELLDKLDRCGTTVVVLIEADATDSVRLELQYQVFDCSWFPMYELRAEPLNKKVDFRYHAAIQQNSGEDWNGVNMKLSTSRASALGNVPQLYPIRLNKVEPVTFEVQSIQDESYSGGTTLAGTRLRSNLEVVGKMVPAVPAFDSSFSTFEVELPQKFTIQTGEGSKKALLAEVTMDGDFWTEVVPGYNEKGFLVAEVVNAFELPILGGETVLFVENQMVGISNLQNTPIGEKLELSFGINEKISVERESGKQNEADRGIIGKKTRLTRQYFTTVKNHSGDDQRIKVKDQFPISENKKIEVKGILPTTEDAEFEANTGVFTLDFVLKAGEDRKIETRFKVTYPQDWIIPTHF